MADTTRPRGTDSPLVQASRGAGTTLGIRKAGEIEITAEMIDVASEAIRPFFDVYDSWLVPVLVEKVAAAFCAAEAQERSEVDSTPSPLPTDSP